MIMHDYHSQQPESLLLIPPMLADSALLYRLLGSHFRDYRLLIPDLSAHGEAASVPFVSAEKEARDIDAYLREAGITRLRLGFGASLGGVVLLELLNFTGVTFDRLFFEGTSLFEKPGILGKTAVKIVLNKHRQAIADPALAVKMLGSLYGREAAEPMSRTFIAATEESIRNAGASCTQVRLPRLAPELQKRCTFAFGDRDGMLKVGKKALSGNYPAAEVKLWPGQLHCQKITADPEKYAEELRKYL